MFKDTKEGQTHSFNDGCGEPEHNNNKENSRSRVRLGKKMKQAAKEKRKTLKNETNPKVFKRKSANEWDFC